MSIHAWAVSRWDAPAHYVDLELTRNAGDETGVYRLSSTQARALAKSLRHLADAADGKPDRK